MSVLKVIEIMASSTTSWDDAVQKGVQKAVETLQGVKSAWVKDQSVTVADGAITEYRVILKVSFEINRPA